MNFTTLFRFLIGQRRAILEVAETKSAVWLGLLFVVSAGFAREYDGEDLLREPWYLAIPLVASLATSFLLFCLVWLASGIKRAHGESFFRTYRVFLGLYWMTAPLAWLYAAPVERLFSAVDATRANLWLLGLVALWRVALMVRVISVLFQGKFYKALPIVMLFADTVILALLYFTPLPIVTFMGGVRHTDSELLIQKTTFLIGALGALSWPIWLSAALLFTFLKSLSRSRLASLEGERRVSAAAWALGMASLFVWIPVLPFAQREQQLRRAVESDLRAGHIDRALAIMSEHQPADFPPHWDPPPRVGYGENRPPLLDVVEAILEYDTKPWVSSVFLQKLDQSAGYALGATGYWEQMDSDQFDQFLTLIDRFPADWSFVENHQEELAAQLDKHSKRTESQKARVRALLGQ